MHTNSSVESLGYEIRKQGQIVTLLVIVVNTCLYELFSLFLCLLSTAEVGPTCYGIPRIIYYLNKICITMADYSGQIS